MSEQPVTEALQFDRADFGANQQAIVCTMCKQAISQSYYDAGGHIICSHCRERMEQAADSWGGTRLAKAAVAGLLAAIAGAILWWGVRELTGYEVGLVSIVIGIGVGRAVRWGSGHRGGRAYQLLAVFLTYAAVAGNYMPDVIKGFQEKSAQETTTTAAKQEPATKPEPVSVSQMALGFLAIFALAAAAPFFGGGSNILGLAIIAFGLWEAWKVNRRIALEITGPYSVTPVNG
jgi:hypothetical protein